MGRFTPENMNIGSVVPHPVLGYIWVTLGEVKRGSGGNVRDQNNQKIKAKTDIYNIRWKSQDSPGTPFDALIT
jgi:hypothetical protein